MLAPSSWGCRFKPRQGLINIFLNKNPVTLGHGDLIIDYTEDSLALDINKAIIQTSTHTPSFTFD